MVRLRRIPPLFVLTSSVALLSAACTSENANVPNIVDPGESGGRGKEGADVPDTQVSAPGSDPTMPAEEEPIPSPSEPMGETGCTRGEPNDAIAQATTLTLGAPTALGICSATDVDVFKIDVPTASVITATAAFKQATGDLDLYVTDGTRDANGKLVIVARSEGDDDGEEVLNVPATGGKTLFVYVAGYKGAQAPYELTVTTKAPDVDRDCFDQCADLIAMPGSNQRNSARALTDHYAIETPLKYAYPRRDLAGLIRYAAREVAARFPSQVSDPIAVLDVCQADGKTPGTDVGSPRHPTTTHVRGKDVDIAYYQTDSASDGQIVCGDGSDDNDNGQAGKYNDGSFCTTQQNIVDWPRQMWFLAKLVESPRFRVVGVDQTFAARIQTDAKAMFLAGDIGLTQYRRLTSGLGYGDEGGWQFHHHHLHLSLSE